MNARDLRVALDVQHINRPFPFTADRGTIFALASGATVAEAALAYGYGHACAEELGLAGAAILMHGYGGERGFVGHYSEREREAASWGAHAYLALHVNAGGGQYGAVKWPAPEHGILPLQSSHAMLLAAAVSRGLEQLPEITTSGTSSLAPGQRGWACVGETPPLTIPVLIEPFFGDFPPEQALMSSEGLARVGHAIALGVLDWWAGVRMWPGLAT